MLTCDTVNTKVTQRTVIALTFLVLILISTVACAGRPQPDAANANSPQTNSEQWQPSKSVPGGFRRDFVGDTSQPGPFKYQLRIPAGARSGASTLKDVKVRVPSGSMFIIIGERCCRRAQRSAAGSVFVVPETRWHDERWDEETVWEAEGVGPMETVVRASEE